MKKTARKKPAAKKKAAAPAVDPRFLPIVEAFAEERDVSRKRMFSSSSVLSVKGKIFAMFVKGRFVASCPGTGSTTSSRRAWAPPSIPGTAG
jgi:hypothetical protein